MKKKAIKFMLFTGLFHFPLTSWLALETTLTKCKAALRRLVFRA